MLCSEEKEKKNHTSILHQLLNVVILCVHLFYNIIFNKIERKIKIKLLTSKVSWKWKYKTVDNEDFHKILTHIECQMVSKKLIEITGSIDESAVIWTLLFERKNWDIWAHIEYNKYDIKRLFDWLLSNWRLGYSNYHKYCVWIL